MGTSSNDQGSISPKQLWLILALSLFFALGVLSFVFEFREFRNYADTGLFVLLFGSAGALVGLLIANFLKSRQVFTSEVNANQPPEPRVVAVLVMFVVGSVSLFAANWLNTVLSDNP